MHGGNKESGKTIGETPCLLNTYVPIHCPAKSEFDEFDEDNNGILTWDEWQSKSG